MKPISAYKAVVSPCSICKNYQTDSMSGGPACPRRVWEERKAAADQNLPVFPPPDYLVQTGTDSKDRLSNPVYYQDGLSVLVWVAAIHENRVAFNRDGTLGDGNILDRESFDTKTISCRSLPVIPEETWAEMLTKGAYKEWDQLLVTPMTEEQEEQDPGAPADQQPTCKVGGFAKRVHFNFNWTQTSPQTDRIRSGT